MKTELEQVFETMSPVKFVKQFYEICENKFDEATVSRIINELGEIHINKLSEELDVEEFEFEQKINDDVDSQREHLYEVIDSSKIHDHYNDHE